MTVWSENCEHWASHGLAARLAIGWRRVLSRARIRLNGLRFFYAAHVVATEDHEIVICSYPRSGTTWMQMIVHQLVAGGADFSHIRLVSPTLEGILLDDGLEVDRSIKPLMIKSHLPYRCTPSGDASYIYVVRHGLDVAWSYYHQYRRLDNYSLSFDVFLDRFLTKGDLFPYVSWFQHVAEFVKNEREFKMLIVSYEDLWQDLGQAIDRIGSFVGTTSPSHRKAEILSRCSFEFMRANEHKLNPVPGRNYIPGSEDGHFIRRGRCGDARPHVSAKALAAYQEQCRRHLGSLMPEYHGLPG